MLKNWEQLIYTEAVMVNPRVHLEKGKPYPFLDMASVDPSSRCAWTAEWRQFAGGGARFAVGDTLLARITPCLENGKIARYCGQFAHEAHGSTEFIVIRGREGITDSAYAYYLTKSEGVSGYAISQMTGTSGRQRVPTESLSNLVVPIPPLPEQRRIAHILGTLDDMIENNRKTAKTLEAMAQAIFKSWFVDFDPVRAKMAGESRESICKRLKLTPEILDLFPDRLVDSELGEIPEGWRVDSIYQIADVIYGAPFNSSEFNARQVGEPLIRIRDLTTEVPGVWTTETHPKGYKVKRGDIVVGMDGEFRAHLWGGAEAWLNQRVCIFAPKKSFSSLFVRNSIVNLLAHVEATETATTVIHIGKNDIDLFFVMIPENNLLHTFNKFYQPFYDAIVRSKWETHKLGDTRDTLLPKLISGEIRVSDVASIIGGSIREPHIDGSSKVTA
ncbi:hypothetical protein HAP94_21555 [Acidithiobacillus ferrivorans]|nr:hypothetical protein [Acidithiobacillus ferrivorans]